VRRIGQSAQVRPVHVRVRQNALVGDTEEPEQHLQTPAAPTLTDEALIRLRFANWS